MIHFLDASALVKRYVRERGSEAVQAILRRGREIAVARVSAVEVPAALARRVRDGTLSVEVGRRHVAELLADLEDVRVVELRPPVALLATDLAWTRGLRAYDAVQLASALHLARATGLPTRFVCADERLLAAASAERLRVARLP